MGVVGYIINQIHFKEHLWLWLYNFGIVRYISKNKEWFVTKNEIDAYRCPLFLHQVEDN